jgi:hypothetical protein
MAAAYEELELDDDDDAAAYEDAELELDPIEIGGVAEAEGGA